MITACGGGGSSMTTTTTTTTSNPSPTITSLSPSSATAGTATTTVTVNGSGFIQSSTVQWNQGNRTTTFVSSTQLQASVTVADLASAGTAQITVANPTPGGGTSTAAIFTINNPAPVVTLLSQSSAIAGSAAFTLTITGTGFVQGSTVQWNQTNRATTFVSTTQLQASVTSADLAAAGTAQVAVVNPTPGGGTSSAATFTVDNPAPEISSLSPASVLAGAAGLTLAVNGTNFVSSSVVQIAGSARPTTFVSSTQLQVSLTVADVASGGVANITVTSPTPGGGSSSAISFTILNPTPTVSSLNPSSILAGTSGVTVAIAGTNFVAGSTVQINGSAHQASVISSSQINLPLSAVDTARAGTDTIAITNPSPGGGTATISLFITQAVPTIASLTPGSAVAGAAGFTMTISGNHFDPAASVQLNGSSRTTTFVSSTEVQANITSADLVNVGAASITVVNPADQGGSSAPFTFFVGSTGGTNFSVVEISQASSDLIADPVRPFLYLSVRGDASTNPNTICPVDLISATITTPQAAGSNPNKLAVSGDGQFLYAGIDGSSSVQRFVLPALTKDINYPLPQQAPFGPSFALDLQVAPSAPNTTAVSIGSSGVSPVAEGGIQIFDNATARPTKAAGFGGGGLYDSIQWDADATAIFAANSDDTGFDFYTLAVTANGISQTHDYGADFSSFANRIHFDSGTGIVYSDDGHAIDPGTGQPVGRFTASAPMVPDSGLNAAFFASSGSGNTVTISAYDLKHFTQVDSISVANVTGGVVKLVRWGQNGLAFTSSSGQLFIIGGSFVSTKQASFLPPPSGTLPPPPPPPGPQTPTISVLNPSAVIVAGTPPVVTISGTNFIASSTATVNGSARATTFVSSSQLQVTLTTADVTNVGTAAIIISNGSANGGDSAPATFFVGANAGTATNGTGFAWTIVSQSASDLAYSAQANVIYVSVPGNAAANGNTISVLDPVTAKIVASQFAGSNPRVLSITSDEQFLYAGIDGAASVQRFALPTLAPDIQDSLGTSGFFGPQFANDLQAAPGAPHTVAVALGQSAATPNGSGVLILDDSVQRSTTARTALNFLRWGKDATTLFGTDSFNGGLDAFSVLSNGVFFNTSYSGISPGRFEFDAGANALYTQNGRAVDPATGLPIGTYNTSGLVAPDSTLNRAFFLSGGSGNVTINSYDLTQFTLLGSITIPNVTGNVRRFVRWGQNGLAFSTDSGVIYLVGGNFVH